MARHSKRWTALAGASLLAISMSAGCGVVNPPSDTEPSSAAVVDQTPTTAEAPTPSGSIATPAATRRVGPRTVAVKRDAITETLLLDGLVVARQQAPITFSGRANVSAVLVKPGDTVKEGEALLELEAPHHVSAATIASQMETARTRLAAAESNLAEAQAQAARPQQSAAQELAASQQQQSIADATSALRLAQDNLTTVQAGASSADRQAAQDSVEAAQAVLQKAQDNLDKLSAGPDQAAVRAGQREVANAQIALTKAQADFDALTRGPDPAAMRDAQAQVQRTQVQLQVAQAAKIDPKADQTTARIQHDQAIQDAQLAIQTAQDRLTQLKVPPPEVDVRAAKQRLQDAQDALAAATDALGLLQAGPDEATLNAAQAAVDKAQQSLDLAEAHAADVNGRPTKAELANAQDRVRKAQASLDNANQPLPPPSTDASGAHVNAFLQPVLDARAEMQYLQSTLDKTSLRAPFDGSVVSVTTRPGAIITSTVVLFTIAKPGPPLVHVELTDEEAGRLSAGQSAAAQFENLNAPLPATIEAVTPAALDGSAGASADVKVNWPDGVGPSFGTPAQVTVTVQEKPDVLLVPTSAVHRTGARATVEVQDGTLRRIVNVQVGLVSSGNAEILSGLSEGQMVLVQAS